MAARSLVAAIALTGCASAPPIAAVQPPRLEPASVAPPVIAAPPAVEASSPICAALDPGLAVATEAVPAIVDEKSSLARFHLRLSELARGSARSPLRIAIYGDSNMTMDWISGELRRAFQARFGDGGHGFVALGKPWNWYAHTDVAHDFWPKSFATYAVSTAPLLDRIYGFAGIAVESLHPGAKTWVATATAGPVGRTFSRLELFYLEHAHAGRVSVRVDGQELEAIDANKPKTAIAVKRWSLPDTAHEVGIFGATYEHVRLFGLTMERDPASVVVDSLGVGALNTRLLASLDEETTAAMLRARNYDLVIFLLDTNLYALPPDHAKLAAKVIAMQRKASPDVSLLMITPPDHVSSKLAAHSDARVVRIAKEKRAIAEANGAAFWDLREAMGGDRSIVKWRDEGLAWTDYIHFTEKGARKVGLMLASALWSSFTLFASAEPSAGCP